MKDKNIHLIGIGGISMSSLARFLINNGAKITGSDKNKTHLTTELEDLGVKIYYSHDAENIKDCDLVIRTAAIHDDNPEVMRALEKQIPVIERAEAYGVLMKNYKNTICIAGTHGKTTTTSMISHITLENNVDPTIMVGSNLPILNGAYRLGSNDYFIAESCEYHNSFLSFSPTVAVILNIEADHLDFFKDLDDIICSFNKFANLVPDNGHIVYNYDDLNVQKCVKDVNRSKISFGLTKDADVYPENLVNNHGYYSFDAMYNGKLRSKVSLSVPGKHNLYNALAALATSIALKLDSAKTAKALEKFTGSTRRFEKKGEYNGAIIVDDYAHHPTEIRSTLETANQMEFDRVICAFQSHTYTRTEALLPEFIEALKLCDHFVSVEIYSAREVNLTGISGKDISDKIDGAVFFKTFDETEKYLRSIAKKGDLIITMGAGDIVEVGENILK